MSTDNPDLTEARQLIEDARTAFRADWIAILEETGQAATVLAKAIGDISRWQALDALDHIFRAAVVRRLAQQPPLPIAEMREAGAAGATHECSEWVKDGHCQLCDREVTP